MLGPVRYSIDKLWHGTEERNDRDMGHGSLLCGLSCFGLLGLLGLFG
jgi:hypothetical protein